MPLLARLFWSIWMAWCVAFAVFAASQYGEVWNTRCVIQVLFVVASFWFIELFAFAAVPLRYSVLHRLIRKHVYREARIAVCDFAALGGMAAFNIIGAVATLYSRNASFFLADSAIGVAFVLVYVARRRHLSAFELDASM